MSLHIFLAAEVTGHVIRVRHRDMQRIKSLHYHVGGKDVASPGGIKVFQLICEEKQNLNRIIIPFYWSFSKANKQAHYCFNQSNR